MVYNILVHAEYQVFNKVIGKIRFFSLEQGEINFPQ